MCTLICDELAVNHKAGDSVLLVADDGLSASLPDLLLALQQYEDGQPAPPGWHAATRQCRLTAKLLKRTAQPAAAQQAPAADGPASASEDGLPAHIKREVQESLRKKQDT